MKPADRLHDIREQLHALKAEEAVLREGFINGTLPLTGDEHIVVVETKVNERLDLKAMRQHVAEAIWRPFVISTAASRVSVKPKSAPPAPTTQTRSTP
jgi:hypothetical protein